MKPAAWFVYLNIVGLLVVAIWFRGRDLANLPGINGDEAWYGVQAELVLRGQPFAWRTPTGNLLNPLFFGPQVLLHALFEPSFALLRTMAVASGMAALAVNFWLCRSVFGRRVALISTVVLAVLPINIVYSRLAWDASQSLLLTLPAVYLPLRAIIDPPRKVRWSVCGLAALSAAIIVHPTNLFVAPIVGVCSCLAWRNELSTIWRRSLGNRALSIAAVGLMVMAGVAAGSRSSGFLSRPTNPVEYAAFAVNLGRLFSGATVYEYVSGSVGPANGGSSSRGFTLYDLAASVVFCLLGCGIYRYLRRGSRSPIGTAEQADDAVRIDELINHRRIAVIGLVIGWAVSLIAFFIIAGPAAIAPHFERYGICLIGAGAILAAVSIDWWLDRPACGGIATGAIAMATGWLLLAVFQINFFDFMEATGGRSHRTFRTAAIEPKQAAFDLIVGQSEPGSNVRVLTSEWWNYWPLRYLSLGQRRIPELSKIVVEQYSELPKHFPTNARSGKQIWIVEFDNSPACEEVRSWRRAGNPQMDATTIPDFSGQPLLCIFRIDGSDEAGELFNPEPSTTAITRNAVVDG
ncbi:MAG TPA: hypothetical protein VG056_12525, partial [Pirellulales bacterium]|nr:hypothetical protein [Pirellulales bacterium]